jgi:hypothetical protein
MARFNYDVDKITRYIDIHKQFQGGLKTVDTDDALKDVYLREAENVSLSEFNFIEKRYGLHKLDEHNPWGGATPNIDSVVQGYFEYYVDADTVDKIIVIEGKFYIDRDGNGFEEVEFFTIPEGTPFIDLSPLGIYTQDVVNDIATGTAFGTQVPRFLATAPTGGVTVGVVGQIYYAFSNDTYYVCVTNTTTWNTLSTQTDSYPAAGFIQGEFYHDTRRNVSYKWNAVSGKTGIMTANDNIYRADIQTTRPVEGVRLDDKLYIATGTYPVYYIGDGKIYVFPGYEMSDLDLQKRGYNLNSLDIENDLYETKSLTETTGVGPTYEGNDVSVRNAIFKEAVKYPLIPYKFGGGTLTFNAAYHLYQNSTNNYWTSGVNQFDSETLPEISPGGALWQTPYAYWTVASSIYTIEAKKFELQLTARVFRKPAGTLGSNFYEVVGNNSRQFKLKRSGTSEVVSSLTNDLAYPVTFPSATNGVVLEDLVINLTDLEVGYFDYKIEFILNESSYRYQKDANGNDDRTKIPVFYTDTFVLGNTEFNNIWTTPEKLEDYDEAPLDTLKVHSCNRLTEHNGRLCFFGNVEHPDYLFFSDISSKEYIPYFYTLQFTNDLQEPVNAITKFMNILVVQSPSYTWGIKGDSPLPLSELEGEIYRKITINPTIGCIAPHSVKNVRNQIYFLSKEGIFTLKALYAEDLRYNVDPIDRNIYNIVPRDTNAIAAYFDDQYWLHFPNTGETLRYYVDKKAWVKDTYLAWHNFGGIHKYINEEGRLRFITELCQFTSGGVIKIFDVELDYSLPSDLGTFFESKMTTAFLNQNHPFHPKNYKEAKLDFTIQNEYNIGKLPIYGTAYGENVSPNKEVFFNAVLIPRHFYQITFDKENVPTAGTYIIYVNDNQRAEGTFTNTTPTSESWLPIEFQILDTDVAPYTIKIRCAEFNLSKMDEHAIPPLPNPVAVLKDSTYDNSITFTNVVLSEEGTLNIDPIDSYNQATIERVINLGTRLGNWTFGTSDFGNILTAVETIKLAGKGYNCKISVTENGKSKWTLESLGITYKMKKARSR